MTLVPARDTFLGPLQISEVFFEHDGPRLFTAETPSKHLFLANCVDENEDEGTETYLYVSLSHSRMKQIRSGAIPLRDAFTNPADGFVYVITSHYDQPIPANRLSTMPAIEVSDDWLPVPGVRLDIPTETLPSFNPEAFSALAAEEFRARVAVEVYPRDSLRTEYSLRSLSRLAGSFQDVLDSLAQEERGRPTARGVIPEEILAESELVFADALAASFVLVLAPKATPTLVGHELVTKSTTRLLELLRAADHQQELTRLLAGYGVRARSKFRGLLTTLSDDDTGAAIFLADHQGAMVSTEIHLDSVRNAIEIIDDRNPDNEKVELPRVTLIGVNLRTGIFELFDNVVGQRYSGQMSPEAKSEISGLPTGDDHFYSAIVLKSIEYSTMTSDVTSSYRLLHIQTVL